MSTLNINYIDGAYIRNYISTNTDSTEAYVSLVTNNQYAHGAIALGRSLRDTRTERKLCLMITEQVSEDMR